MSSARIRDVANKAGVSIKTVSRVPNNEPFVKSSTQDKVLAAIDELGYVASMSARRLDSGQSYTIGLIFLNARCHYTQDVLKGVIETARKSGYSTLLHPCDVCNDIDAKEVMNLVHHKVVDGLIYTPPADKPKKLSVNYSSWKCPLCASHLKIEKVACPMLPPRICEGLLK